MLSRRIVHMALSAFVAFLLTTQWGAGTKVWGVDKPAEKPAKSTAKVDLNSASEEQLQELSGIGPANAKKIISGRPYKSVSELSKAGIPAATIKKIMPLVTVKGPAPEKAEKAAKPAGKVDLNTATEEELQDLPGIGPANAKKIVSGRPYKNVGDLSKAGIPAATIEKITPLVTAKASAPPAKIEKSAAQVDLNAATEEELQELPGIGPANAKKIVSGRPYKNVADLSKAGIPAATIEKITPLVTVKAPNPLKKAEKAADRSDDPTVKRTPPKKGMVWANTESKIYHKEGSRWYGNTKEGKWMTEQDAIKEGYRVSKDQE